MSTRHPAPSSFTTSSGVDAMFSFRPRRNSRGFTLAEFLVASAIFLFVVAVAYSAFENSRQSYRIGEDNAEMQQRTRLTFEMMLEELRHAGFDYNRDGVETVYPDHPDEQLEWIGVSAITFRGNLDYTNQQSGREPGLEVGPDDSGFGEVCCPIVTTGNDEIVTYALRSDDASKNVDSLEFKVDLSAPRDASWDPLDGSIDGEEMISITNVDFTNANPPYTLMRFHLDDNGEVVSRALAANVRSLSFSYEDLDGNDFHCLSREDDGSCLNANRMAFALMGGADDVSGVDSVRRSGRAAVRRVNVEITGMTEDDDLRYVDPDDSVMPHRRKMVLDTVITPQNLGLRGRPDLDSEDAGVPTGVELCGGQCNTVRVEWNQVVAADSYTVNLYIAGQAEPFFNGSTPGIAVPNTNPPRVYAVFQDLDHGAIVDGTTLTSTVQSRTGEERLSDESAYSPTLQLTDEVRLEAPRDLKATGFDTEATGWPMVDDNLVPPLTEGTSPDVARANRILVSWVAPEYALDVLDQSLPADTWTTRAGGAAAALGCDSEMADVDSDGTFDRLRTRSRELRGDTRYLIFRDTDPHFVPTEDHFIGEAQGQVAVSEGRVWFEDRTLHAYSGGVFQQTDHALPNCRNYYYRVRAVDACWTGSDPASRSDPHLSPFAPALNPDPSADDSDDVSLLSGTGVGAAIPGFAVPAAKPRRVSRPHRLRCRQAGHLRRARPPRQLAAAAERRRRPGLQGLLASHRSELHDGGRLERTQRRAARQDHLDRGRPRQPDRS
jgi:prepilin-type N-terminal cleavage/methylation domain-containing protein